MADNSNGENTWSPWAHPKAQLWFAELFEKTHLPLMIEDEMERPLGKRSEEVTRLMVALTLLLGREGVWPQQHKAIIRTVVRRAAELEQSSGSTSGKAMTIEDHRMQGMQNEELKVEVENLRRRIGMSNRTSKLAPPAWGKFWS